MARNFLRSVALAALLTTAEAEAVTINFSFSSDLTDPQAVNKVPGTITGRIVGLTDNATSAATAVYVDTYPAATLGTISDPSYATPINVEAWDTLYDNSFTLVNGAVTAAAFHTSDAGVGGFDQFWLNIPLGYIKGNTNYFDAGNNNNLSIWNNEGLDGITFSSGSATPEPASWLLMIGGFGLVGTALRRRAVTVVA